MMKMIVQDSQYYPYIALFLIASVVFFFIIKNFSKTLLEQFQLQEFDSQKRRLFVLGLSSLLSLFLLLIAARGRVTEKSPIRWGTAFFSEYTFANQLGLNPVFTFVQSWIDSRKHENQKLHLINDSIALVYVKNKMNEDVNK